MQTMFRRDFEAAKKREESLRRAAQGLLEVHGTLLKRKSAKFLLDHIAEAKEALDREANVIHIRLKDAVVVD